MTAGTALYRYAYDHWVRAGRCNAQVLWSNAGMKMPESTEAPTGERGNVGQLQTALACYIHYCNHDCVRLKLEGLSSVQYKTQPLAA